jgi:hypothetical protein
MHCLNLKTKTVLLMVHIMYIVPVSSPQIHFNIQQCMVKCVNDLELPCLTLNMSI